MGGDSFEGIQKLTNFEYQIMTQQLIKRLQAFCQRIQPYTPMPEKEVHGDIDFVVLLKQEYLREDIVKELQLTKYKLNNDNTINSVYKNKQVDFYFVNSQKEFQLVHFYKSYSGLGGYLGEFFPSKLIKVTHKGIFAPVTHFHLKMEFLISDDVQKIMEFYGLDYEQHKQGYKSRKQLYEYLRTVRFLDEGRYVEEVKQVKGTSKLMWGMVEYLKLTGINWMRKTVTFNQPLNESLEFFGKEAQFGLAFSNLINSKIRQQNLSKKFNAVHMLKRFKIVPKEVDKLKLKFKQIMFENDQQKYLDFVQSHTVEEILDVFGEKCGLETKEQQEMQKLKS